MDEDVLEQNHIKVVGLSIPFWWHKITQRKEAEDAFLIKILLRPPSKSDRLLLSASTLGARRTQRESKFDISPGKQKQKL